MLHTLSALLAAEGITLCAPISLSDCTLLRPYLLERAGITSGTAFLFAVPYYTTKCEDPTRNISAYAVSRDYHRFFEQLFADILPQLRTRFPKNRFVGFTDHSPLAEGEAAVRAGLGFYGCNHLFLTEAHSSFVFLGEVITDAKIDAPARPPRACFSCGSCSRACPVGLEAASCLSSLTQKKGELSETEEITIRAHACAWGCDRCQESCPVTKRAKESGSIYTSIAFFNESAVPYLSTAVLSAMSDAEFEQRAYSWRGRAVILRNLTILEKGEGE